MKKRVSGKEEGTQEKILFFKTSLSHAVVTEENHFRGTKHTYTHATLRHRSKRFRKTWGHHTAVTTKTLATFKHGKPGRPKGNPRHDFWAVPEEFRKPLTGGNSGKGSHEQISVDLRSIWVRENSDSSVLARKRPGGKLSKEEPPRPVSSKVSTLPGKGKGSCLKVELDRP